MVAVIRYFQSIQGSQRAVCSDDYRDLNNWIGIMYQALQVKGERGQVNGLGDSEKEVHWKVMEYLNQPLISFWTSGDIVYSRKYRSQ